MIVGIDGRSLEGDQAGRGVAHYTASLLTALASNYPGDSWRVLLPGGDPERLPDALRGGAVQPVARTARRSAHLAAAVVGRPRLDRMLGDGLDVVWAPAPAPLALSAELPLALTVHDLSFDQRPGDYTPYERLWHRLGRLGALARRAARVLAVSAATREVAIERWRLEPSRVVVIAPGVSRPQTPPDAGAVAAARRRYGLPERYLLFVGALEPRKAPDVLARAYARARAEGLDAALAVVGTGRWARELGGPGVYPLGRVAERAELEALYAGALALVMPSWIEGYGLPPLEAAACGTPSVVSDLPAFGETLGAAALRVPPGNPDALADAMERIAADEALRIRLAREAAAAVASRTWERAAAAARTALAEAAAA
jgi:glycosyltransferase involved in cell wall biosynthesis